LSIKSELADVDFVAFEEERVIAVGRDFKNLALIACRDKKISCFVESEVPDVLGSGLEENRRAPL